MPLFDERKAVKPYEYPELLKYKDAIRNSYWVHTEFNFTSDIQDYKVEISETDREIITRCLLAISTIEVAVKRFWGDLYKKMPKTEIDAVGATFAESEIRHLDAYSHLLELLGLNDRLEDVYEVPAISDRMDYLKKYLIDKSSDDNKKFAKSVMLFSLFIENVSLFSQFLIIKSFKKYKQKLKKVGNVVEATSKEEIIHGLFGSALVNIMRSEYPSWFDEELEEELTSYCYKAYEAEHKIIDWILEPGDFFLDSDTIKEFIKDRFNQSMDNAGFSKPFEVDGEKLEELRWFDMEMMSKTEGDFFDKILTDYTKFDVSVTADDLF